MKIVEGLCGIKATVICDSISEVGVRLTTMEIEYPRIILSELNTHRMLSKNSASSRAIPAEKMFQQLTGRPVRFGANVSGMQDGGEHTSLIEDYSPEEWWHLAQLSAKTFSQAFSEAGYHKQVFNRLTEPFQMMKTVISGTEWANFFYLRNDDMADPTIRELARCMQEAREQSVPQVLRAGEWHLPYVEFFRDDSDGAMYRINDTWTSGDCTGYGFVELEYAIKVSCARTAAVSFRNVDYGVEKCLQVYDRLLNSGKLHGSALEHAATPTQESKFVQERDDYSVLDVNRSVNVPDCHNTWQEGISHVDRKGWLWSGNFKGFIQHRKTIRGENHVHG